MCEWVTLKSASLEEVKKIPRAIRDGEDKYSGTKNSGDHVKQILASSPFPSNTLYL